MSNDASERFSQIELDFTPTTAPRQSEPKRTTPIQSETYAHVSDGTSNRHTYNNKTGATTCAELVAAVPELGATVSKERVYLADGSVVPDIQVTVRTFPDGMRQTFGRAVGERYTVAQDSRMLDLVQILLDKGIVSRLNGGAYKGRTWVYGERPGATLEVCPGDAIQARALFGNSHDGSIPMVAGWPANAVVCQNTMLMAVKSKDSRLLKLRHTASIESNILMVEQALEQNAEAFLSTGVVLQAMARKRATEDDLRSLVGYTFSKWADDDSVESDDQAGNRVYNQILENYHDGAGMAEIAGRRGTVWGAYNAVTEYLTHQRGRGNDDVRFDSNMFGPGAGLLERAFQGAVNQL